MINKRIFLLLYLAGSLIVFAVLALYIRLQWYPGQFVDVNGGWQKIHLLAWVTFLSGPFLGWLFIRPQSPGFKKSVIFVFSIQFVALSVTLVDIGWQRPEVAVYYQGKFYSLSRAEVDRARKRLSAAGKTMPGKQEKDDSWPIDFAYLDELDEQEYLEDVLEDLPEYPLRVDRFRSLKDNWKTVSRNENMHKDEMLKLKQRALMAGIKVLDSKVECYRLKGKHGEAHILFDGNNQKFLTTLPDKAEVIHL